MSHSALIPIPLAFAFAFVLIAAGILTIVFRKQVRERVRKDQAATFGEAFASSRKAGPNAMIGPGAGALIVGAFMLVYSIVRVAIS